MTDPVDAQAGAAEPRSEAEKVRDELHLMYTSGIIEVAVRNASVAEYMNHWEARAEKAEATLTTQAARIAEQDLLYKALVDLSEHNYRMASNRANAAEAEVTRLREALERANERLPGVETPMMGGDNLAILLCSFFDDGDKETEDDTGWSQNARDGYEEVIAAIRHHYSAALRAKEPADG